VTLETRRVAGWYDDQTDAALLRYWDGSKWSPHTAPRPPDDAIDEATSVRPLAEHTTLPLPPEFGAAAASGAGASHRVAWIAAGAVLVVGVVAIVIATSVG
jgi:Protein of unknown function (DUF2510)